MCLYPFSVKNPRTGKMQTVKCGKCLECLQSQTVEWALRIVLESKQYKDNCCITLTYDNEHVPDDLQLRRRDIQLFIKSLRKKLDPLRIRVFYSGEYGEKRGRPHFHLIVFNWIPDDLQNLFIKNGEQFYVSKTVSDLWKRGNILVGALTFQTAFYCAKYLQKFKGTEKEVKPFVGMSNRPGIAYNAITYDMLKDGKIYYNGKVYPIPRYFVKVLERDRGILDSDVLELRSRRIRNLYDSIRRQGEKSLESRLEREKKLLGKESWEIYKKGIDNTPPP
ncbi:replication initiator protein [Peromfec virus RodF8_56]|uniref:Replication initiator protein n=1 Tax=Peromfec virus RodF8_56 TaxID=2929384 RepID=A0A976R7P1_9VIRU|nr:replication initiator protein [Peromfec virus RodF8_56]